MRWLTRDYQKYFKVEVVADWEFYAIFGILMQAKFEKTWEVFKFGHTFVFAIGPVPVAMKPYISLDFGIKLHKLSLKAGAEWRYGEEWTVGYEYMLKRGEDHPVKNEMIRKREKHENNGFQKHPLELVDEKDNTCGLEVSTFHLFGKHSKPFNSDSIICHLSCFLLNWKGGSRCHCHSENRCCSVHRSQHVHQASTNCGAHCQSARE